MLKTLPRRKRLLLMTASTALLFLIIVAVAIWLLSKPEAPYQPGEKIEGLTAELARAIPPDHPKIKFVNVAKEAGILFQHFSGQRSTQLPEDMGSGAAWGDYDNDGWLDLFVANEAGPLAMTPEELGNSPAHCALYHNNGNGTLTEVSASAGVDFRGWGMAAAWGDYNNDGWLDLFISCYGENVFYQNNGNGTFTDRTKETQLGGLNGFWESAAWTDFNRDGFLDLYVCGYVKYVYQETQQITLQYDVEVPASLNPSSFKPERNLLYRNNGNGTFTEKAEKAGVANPQGRSLSAAWCDFDEDGWPDLYVANDVSDNVMFRNLGNEKFEDISHAAWVGDYRGAMGLGVGDWDGDQDMDIFITHWIAQENALYSNLHSQLAELQASSKGLRFMDEADRFGLGQIALDFIGWGASFFDYNNDGKLDLFVVNGSTFQQKEKTWLLEPMPYQLFWNRGAKEGFYEIGAVSGEIFQRKYVGRGAAFGDYDNDGDIDIFVVENGGPGMLLRNEGGNKNHWLAVHLQGRHSNRQAIGAKLRLVVADGLVQIRQIGAQASYCSQNSLIEHFGLGSTAKVDTLEIIWPSGRRQTLQNLAADQTVNVIEGENFLYLKNRSSHNGTENDSNAKTLVEKERIKRFWEIYREATDHRIAGRIKKAAESYRRALALNGGHEDALYYLGNMCLELGEYQTAEASWQRLAQINPHSARAHLQLGNLYLGFEQKDFFNLTRAEGEFQHALKINQEETGPVLRLGQIALIRGELPNAKHYFDAVIATNFKSVEAHFLNGYVAWRTGNVSTAETMFGEAIKFSQADKPVQGVLSEGDTKSGRAHVAPKSSKRQTPFQDCLGDLAELNEASARQQMQARYEKLEALLKQMRKNQ